MPIAIVKSWRPPCFGKSAGARLAVARRIGKSKRDVCNAARTRSFASLTSAFGGWADFVLTMDPGLKEKLGCDPVGATAEIAVEKWLAVNAGNRGIGAVVPRSRESRVKRGALCALRSSDPSWSIGVVRGLFRDSADQLGAGIELVGMNPSSLWLQNVGQGGLHLDHRANADASIYDCINVIELDKSLETARACALRLARGDFIPGVVFAPMTGEWRSRLRFDELLGQGDDFERAGCGLIARD